MSHSTRFSIASDVFERFPTYSVALVECRAEHAFSAADELAKLRADAATRHIASFGDGDLKELEPIRVWREAFSAAGWSPSKYPASVEALAKRVARNGELPSILPLVDLANVASLTYLVPVGSHDVASFNANELQVRLATADDEFVPVGPDTQPEKAAPEEIVYASGTDIRTRRWVWRQSRSALVSAESTHVLLPVDGFTDTTWRRVEAAAEFLGRTFEDLFGASAHVHRLDLVNRSVTLKLS